MRRINRSTWTLICVGIVCIGGIVWWWTTYQDASFVPRFAIEHTDIREGHFKDVKVESVQIDNKVCTSAVFDHCQFMYTKFKDTDFSRSEMTDTVILSFSVQDCNFEHANLQRSGWIDGQWKGCNLGFADLRGVNAKQLDIIDCDLHAANLDGIDLKGCRYDTATKWPPNFNPIDSGAVPLKW